MEKTVSGISRRKSSHSVKKQIQGEPIPPLNTLKRNAQRKIKRINNNTIISELIEDNYYKTISIENGKLILNVVYKDYEIRKELVDFMKKMNQII